MLKASLRCLEVFVTAAEAGSFSAASAKLNIAQPSVSAHIAALERAVGGPVFARHRGSRPILTDLGESVLVHARDMLARATDLRSDVMNLLASGGERVVVSCQRSLANFTLNRALTSFALAHPDTQLVVRVGKQEDVLSDMREGRSDIGCFLSNDEQRGFRSTVIGKQDLLLIVAQDHPLARRRRITPAEVAAYPFVGPPPESLFGRSINAILARAGIRGFRTAAQATEYQFLRELVAARVGIACSPESSVRSDVSSGRLRVLDVDAPGLSFDIRLLTSPSRPRTSAMQSLTAFLRAQIIAGQEDNTAP